MNTKKCTQLIALIAISILYLGCSDFRHLRPPQPKNDTWEKANVAEIRQSFTSHNSKPNVRKINKKLSLLPDLDIPLPDAKYKTPLAGQNIKIKIIGGSIQPFPELPIDDIIPDEEIEVESRDRSNITAIEMGSYFFSEEVGDISIAPFGAFFLRRTMEDKKRRLRAIISGLYNEIEYTDSVWNTNGVEALFSFQNNTIPLSRSEIIEGNRAGFTDVEWGSVFAGFGIGWRKYLGNRNSYDNYVKTHLIYEPGFEYNKPGDDIGDDVELPRDTFFHRIRWQFEIDLFTRNFVELLHEGWAFGIDASFTHRDRWDDHAFSDVLQFEEDNTRDYLQLKGYFAAATKVPFLSDRHHLVLRNHVGWMPNKNWDRFSALRIGGGPSQNEADDLSRPVFPGANFNQFIAERYLLVSLEYRFELAVFSYLHVRGTLVWGKFGFLQDDEFETKDAQTAITAGLTTGFLFNSLIIIEYTFDYGFVRQDSTGNSLLLNIAKSF